MIIGDGESVFIKVLDILEQRLSKSETLENLAKLEGVYVLNLSNKVKKITEELNTVIYTPIISEKSYFKNTFRTNVPYIEK